MPLNDVDLGFLRSTGKAQVLSWLEAANQGSKKDLEAIARWVRLFVIEKVAKLEGLGSGAELEKRIVQSNAEEIASHVVARLLESIDDAAPGLFDWINSEIGTYSDGEEFIQVDDRWLEGDYSNVGWFPIYIPGKEPQYKGVIQTSAQELIKKELRSGGELIDSNNPRLELFLELLDSDFEFSSRVTELISRGILGPRQILANLTDFDQVGLLGPDGKPIQRGSREHGLIVSDILSADSDLLDVLKMQPGLMREVTPRKFEEIVAEILFKLGYEVSLTKATRDNGYDIFAAKRDALGTFFFLVECKRYLPPRKVGVEVVRTLSGTVDLVRAHAGILVTTSQCICLPTGGSAVDELHMRRQCRRAKNIFRYLERI